MPDASDRAEGPRREDSALTPGTNFRAQALAPLNLLCDERPAVWLRSLPVAEVTALTSGAGGPGEGLSWHEDYPMPETVDAAALTVTAHRATGWSGRVVPPWWLYQIVLGDEVVGDAGFHGPPAASGPVEVEIGYAVVPALRGRGIARRAGALLLDRAWRGGADVVRAETDPDNAASQRVLRALGFQAEAGFRYHLLRPKGSASSGKARRG